jgi:predicted ATPase
MTVLHKPNFFVLTGGSSSGKSSIVEGLKERGHICVPEAGRIVVREERAAGKDGLPWINLARFRDLIFEKSLQAFEAHGQETRPVFFDRSFIEAISCSKGLGVGVPERHQEIAASHRFNTKVFVTPPWQEIFTNDAERKTTFEGAVLDFETNVASYEGAGYALTEVPRLPVAERFEFVLGEVGI